MLLRRDAASFPFYAPMVPKPVVDLEELGEHCPGGAPGTYAKSRNLRQYNVVVGQYPATPEVEEE